MSENRRGGFFDSYCSSSTSIWSRVADKASHQSSLWHMLNIHSTSYCIMQWRMTQMD